MPSEGFTIVLSFPKGLIPAPSLAQRFAWLLKDNRGILVALLGLILLIGYCVREWSRVGRDPRKGVVIARYEPPDGQTPASLRFLMRMGYDMRCFSAEVLALAVAGCLRIVRDKGFFKDEWRLERTRVRSRLQARRTASARCSRACSRTASRRSCSRTPMPRPSLPRGARIRKRSTIVLQPRYYKQNNGSIGKGILLAAVFVLLAFWIDRRGRQAGSRRHRRA